MEEKAPPGKKVCTRKQAAKICPCATPSNPLYLWATVQLTFLLSGLSGSVRESAGKKNDPVCEGGGREGRKKGRARILALCPQCGSANFFWDSMGSSRILELFQFFFFFFFTFYFGV